MLFWTRHANLRRVENYIYDPSARIIKNPLNSTVFWKRRLNPATRRLNSATRSLNSATRQILHWNIVVYFDEASSQLGKASSQLGDASAQLRDASKMQLWPQWLTILLVICLRVVYHLFKFQFCPSDALLRLGWWFYVGRTVKFVTAFMKDIKNSWCGEYRALTLPLT